MDNIIDISSFARPRFEDPRAQIRLLCVTSASGNAQEQLEVPIKCELTVHDLKDVDDRYVAISYTWGRKDREKVIWINNVPVRVGFNCWYALCQVRLHSSSTDGLYWIDSVCIDQGSHSEKRHQILRMKDIYSRARAVAVCLGADSPHHRDLQLHHIHTSSPLVKLRLVAWMSQLQYFKRLWTVQECILAKEIRILFGTTHIKGDSLRSAISHWRGTMRRDGDVSNLYELEGVAPSIGQNKIPQLADLVLRYGDRLCFDARDKIFGLLSLAPKEIRERISINYEASLVEVLLDYIRAHAKIVVSELAGDRFLSSLKLLIAQFQRASETFKRDLKAFLAWQLPRMRIAASEVELAHTLCDSTSVFDIQLVNESRAGIDVVHRIGTLVPWDIPEHEVQSHVSHVLPVIELINSTSKTDSKDHRLCNFSCSGSKQSRRIDELGSSLSEAFLSRCRALDRLYFGCALPCEIGKQCNGLAFRKVVAVNWKSLGSNKLPRFERSDALFGVPNDIQEGDLLLSMKPTKTSALPLYLLVRLDAQEEQRMRVLGRAFFLRGQEPLALDYLEASKLKIKGLHQSVTAEDVLAIMVNMMGSDHDVMNVLTWLGTAGQVELVPDAQLPDYYDAACKLHQALEKQKRERERREELQEKERREQVQQAREQQAREAQEKERQERERLERERKERETCKTLQWKTEQYFWKLCLDRYEVTWRRDTYPKAEPRIELRMRHDLEEEVQGSFQCCARHLECPANMPARF